MEQQRQMMSLVEEEMQRATEREHEVCTQNVELKVRYTAVVSGRSVFWSWFFGRRFTLQLSIARSCFRAAAEN